jgi:hypothetical protein
VDQESLIQVAVHECFMGYTSLTIPSHSAHRNTQCVTRFCLAPTKTPTTTVQ